MELLMAVEERQSWLGGRYIHFHLLPGRHDDDILPDTRHRLAAYADHFESMAVQVNGVVVRALVVEQPPVPAVSLHADRIYARMRFSVDGPMMAVVGRSEHECPTLVRFVGWFRSTEGRVTPRAA